MAPPRKEVVDKIGNAKVHHLKGMKEKSIVICFESNIGGRKPAIPEKNPWGQEEFGLGGGTIVLLAGL